MLQYLKIKSCNNNGNRVSIFFSILLLGFPLFSLLPLIEPFIYGLTIIAGILTIFLGLKLLFRDKCILYIPYTSLFYIFSIFLGYCFFSGVFIGNKHSLLPLLNVFFLTFIYLNYLPCFHNFESVFSRIASYSLFPYLVYAWINTGFSEKCFIFGHSHFSGTWFLVLLPVQAFAYHNSKNTKERIFFLILLCANFFWLLFFSDSVALSFLSIFSLLSCLTFLLKKDFLHWGLWGGVALFPLWILFFKHSVIHSLGERLSIWKLIWEHYQEIPFWGVGIQKFETFFSTLLTGSLIQNPKDYRGFMAGPVEWAHNELVHFFVEYGYPGFILSLTLCFFFFKEFYDRSRRSDSFLLFYSGLLLMVLYSFFSFPFRMPATTYLCLLLFIVFSGKSIPRNLVAIQWKTNLSRTFLMTEIFTVALAIYAYILYQNAAAHYFYTKAFMGTSQGLMDLKNAKKAVSYNPYSKIYQYGLAKKYLDYHDFLKAEYHFKQSALYSYSWCPLFGWAVALDFMGRGEKAMDLYEKIKKIAPDFDPAAINQATLEQRFQLLNKKLSENSRNK